MATSINLNKSFNAVRGKRPQIPIWTLDKAYWDIVLVPVQFTHDYFYLVRRRLRTAGDQLVRPSPAPPPPLAVPSPPPPSPPYPPPLPSCSSLGGGGWPCRQTGGGQSAGGRHRIHGTAAPHLAWFLLDHSAWASA